MGAGHGGHWDTDPLATDDEGHERTRGQGQHDNLLGGSLALNGFALCFFFLHKFLFFFCLSANMIQQCKYKSIEGDRRALERVVWGTRGPSVGRGAGVVKMPCGPGEKGTSVWGR